MSLLLYGLVVWLLASIVSGLFIGHFCAFNEMWRNETGVVLGTATGAVLDEAA